MVGDVRYSQQEKIGALARVYERGLNTAGSGPIIEIPRARSFESCEDFGIRDFEAHSPNEMYSLEEIRQALAIVRARRPDLGKTIYSLWTEESHYFF